MPCRSVGSAFGPPRNPSPPLGDNDGHHGHTPTRKHPSSLEEVPRGNIHDPELPCDFSVLLRGLTQHRAEYRQLPAGLPRRNGLGIAARVHRTLPHGRRAGLHRRQEDRDSGVHPEARRRRTVAQHPHRDEPRRLLRHPDPRRVPVPIPVLEPVVPRVCGLATWLLLVTTISGVFGRYLYRHLPAFNRAFAIWKPTHLVVTALFFVFALAHVWIETMGGG